MTSSHLYLNSRRNSITLGSVKDEAQTPQGNASTADVSGGEREPLTNGFDSPAVKPRLVGLSQPFFATSPPLETPKQQLAAIEQVAAAATRRGDKVRVLVAEDNIGKHGPVVQTGCLTSAIVNQEVVLRMLKLEDIYGQFHVRYVRKARLN